MHWGEGYGRKSHTWEPRNTGTEPVTSHMSETECGQVRVQTNIYNYSRQVNKQRQED